MRLPYILQLFVLSQSILLQGCSLPFVGKMSGTGLNKEEFEHYVADVFRFQNQMTSEVMMLTSMDEGNNLSELIKSEQHMHQVCEPLNESASREFDGAGNSSIVLQWRIVKTARECDRAAHEVKALLNH